MLWRIVTMGSPHGRCSATRPPERAIFSTYFVARELPRLLWASSSPRRSLGIGNPRTKERSMDDEKFQSNALVLVLFGQLVSFGCSGSSPEPKDASRVSSAEPRPRHHPGRGAPEPTDVTPAARILA
jgi:hypothetical protein